MKKVELFDPFIPNSYDLGGNFYLDEKHLHGEANRAVLCQPKLAELNPYVDVTVSSANDFSLESILNMAKGHTCVVVTVPMKTRILFELNKQVRSEGGKIVYTLALGLFGQVFCDFGENFIVNDKNGEQPLAGLLEALVVSDIGEGKLGLSCKVLEDQGRHGLENGDVITFSKVKHEALIDTDFPIKVTGPFTFTIEVDLGLAKDTVVATQGYYTEVKQPIALSHRSLKEVISGKILSIYFVACINTTYTVLFVVTEPGEDLMMTDFAKFDMPLKLHHLFSALRAFVDNNNRLPSADDISSVKLSEGIDTKLLKALFTGSRAVLSPTCAFIGGIAGQECLKALSKKFTPIKGFLYFESLECIPSANDLPAIDKSINLASRYDSQVLIFGRELTQKLTKLKYFLVGAGAIGCEMLKNWALMGVGCDPGASITITDMDRIEKSNLSRQFLFRNRDIGEFKSTCAGKAAQSINPDMNIVAHQLKLDKTTTSTFSDQFYDGLNGVCTALDNVEARLVGAYFYVYSSLI